MLGSARDTAMTITKTDLLPGAPRMISRTGWNKKEKRLRGFLEEVTGRAFWEREQNVQ